MRIARLTDYAFVILNALRSQAQLSATQLAAQSGLGEATVAKILKYLAHGGLVQSARGAQGGYSLTRPAEQIDLACVIEAMEGPIALTKCTQTTEHECSCADKCDHQAAWVDVNGILRDALANISLTQLEGRAS